MKLISFRIFYEDKCPSNYLKKNCLIIVHSSGVARGWPLGNCPITQKLLPKDFLKCYQLPNAEKCWYPCIFEGPSDVIVIQCLLLWSNQVIQRDEPTTFSIKSMITMIQLNGIFSWKYPLSYLNSFMKNANEWLSIFLSVYQRCMGPVGHGGEQLRGGEGFLIYVRSF